MDNNELRLGDKRAEGYLSNIERRFSSLIMVTSEALFLMNPDWSEMIPLNSQGFFSKIDKPNPNWLQDYIPSEDQKQVMVAIDEAIRTKSVFELEHHILQKDGSTGWTFSRAIPILNDNGEILEWFGAANDITKMKKTEELMLNSKEQYDLVFNSESEGFALYKAIRDDNGKLYDILVLEINPAGAALSGVKRHEQIGKTWLQVWDGKIPDSVFDNYRKVDKSGKPLIFEHLCPITKRWYSNSLNKLDKDRFSVVFFDITELKNVEKFRKELQNLKKLMNY